MTSVAVIYVILNVKNGKVYIGKTESERGVYKRWNTHKRALNGGYHENSHLQRAWNKYGSGKFKFFILEYCDPDQLNEREIHHISIYKARGLVYNMTDGGDGALGYVHSPESRRKMSEAHKSRLPPSEATRFKISNATKGKTLSDETRRKMSEAGKRKAPPTEDHRRKLSEAAKNRSPETRRKLSEAAKKHYIVTNPDGIEFNIVGLTQFCCENGLHTSSMAAVASGRHSHHRRWKCRKAG